MASATSKLMAAAPLMPVGVAMAGELVASTGDEVWAGTETVLLGTVLLADEPQTVSVCMKERVLVTVEVAWSAAGADETVASCQVCESWATALVVKAANAAAATVKRIVIEFAIGMTIDSGLFMVLEASLARCVANERMDAGRQVMFCDGASAAR